MLGAWLNISLCIIETRVHQQLYGQTVLICMCVGSVVSTMAPNIAHLPEPQPMMTSLAATCIAFCATFLLPPSGKHLTSKESINKLVHDGKKAGLVPEVSLLMNYNLQATDSAAYLGLHSMSFSETQTERQLGSLRSQLISETSEPSIVFNMT